MGYILIPCELCIKHTSYYEDSYLEYTDLTESTKSLVDVFYFTVYNYVYLGLTLEQPKTDSKEPLTKSIFIFTNMLSPIKIEKILPVQYTIRL